MEGTMRRTSRFGTALILATAGCTIAGCTSPAAPHVVTATSPAGNSSGPGTTSPGPSVLLVCNASTVPCPALPSSTRPYYRTVQGAVDAARPGDWILIYSGVYHEKS